MTAPSPPPCPHCGATANYTHGRDCNTCGKFWGSYDFLRFDPVRSGPEPYQRVAGPAGDFNPVTDESTVETTVVALGLISIIIGAASVWAIARLAWLRFLRYASRRVGVPR